MKQAYALEHMLALRAANSHLDETVLEGFVQAVRVGPAPDRSAFSPKKKDSWRNRGTRKASTPQPRHPKRDEDVPEWAEEDVDPSQEFDFSSGLQEPVEASKEEQEAFNRLLVSKFGFKLEDEPEKLPEQPKSAPAESKSRFGFVAESDSTKSRFGFGLEPDEEEPKPAVVAPSLSGKSLLSSVEKMPYYGGALPDRHSVPHYAPPPLASGVIPSAPIRPSTSSSMPSYINTYVGSSGGSKSSASTDLERLFSLTAVASDSARLPPMPTGKAVIHEEIEKKVLKPRSGR
jgi:hypothetical protein